MCGWEGSAGLWSTALTSVRRARFMTPTVRQDARPAALACSVWWRGGDPAVPPPRLLLSPLPPPVFFLKRCSLKLFFATRAATLCFKPSAPQSNAVVFAANTLSTTAREEGEGEEEEEEEGGGVAGSAKAGKTAMPRSFERPAERPRRRCQVSRRAEERCSSMVAEGGYQTCHRTTSYDWKSAVGTVEFCWTGLDNFDLFCDHLWLWRPRKVQSVRCRQPILQRDKIKGNMYVLAYLFSSRIEACCMSRYQEPGLT
mmetsp:Transcript_1659/g.3301  ORF Transcript_1659/g.3301 Transcript_1659/m.3301 type:complete len:256 (-) Transcript_1659:176-943(-)